MTTTMPTLSPAAPRQPLPLERLYSHCDPAQLPFDSSAELEPLAAHLGQDRAVQALEFGLQIPHEGYNIFLLGSTGVGKRELLDGVLGPLHVAQDPVRDREAAAAVEIDEPREGDVVPGACELDQPRLHGLPFRRSTRLGACPPIDGRRPEKVRTP